MCQKRTDIPAEKDSFLIKVIVVMIESLHIYALQILLFGLYPLLAPLERVGGPDSVFVILENIDTAHIHLSSDNLQQLIDGFFHAVGAAQDIQHIACQVLVCKFLIHNRRSGHVRLSLRCDDILQRFRIEGISVFPLPLGLIERRIGVFVDACKVIAILGSDGDTDRTRYNIFLLP